MFYSVIISVYNLCGMVANIKVAFFTGTLVSTDQCQQPIGKSECMLMCSSVDHLPTIKKILPGTSRPGTLLLVEHTPLFLVIP
jgi:hypothetical protein